MGNGGLASTEGAQAARSKLADQQARSGRGSPRADDRGATIIQCRKRTANTHEMRRDLAAFSRLEPPPALSYDPEQPTWRHRRRAGRLPHPHTR